MFHNPQTILLHLLRNRERDELYLSVSLRAMSIAMIGVFIPIFLLHSGTSIPNIFIFFIVTRLAQAVAGIPAGMISSRYGMKHSILVSIPLLLAGYLALYFQVQLALPFLLSAILLGASDGLFWVPLSR